MQLHSPAAERNREPILGVLERVLPARGLVLELASGTGQHAVHFAAARPGNVWQPSDPDARARASIAAYVTEAGLANLRPPIALDVEQLSWPLSAADAAALVAIVAINLVHIAPWSATLALMAGAGARLLLGGVLVTYGPYRIGGAMAPSNEAFDADLRGRNPAWGVRALEDLAAEDARHHLVHEDTVALPAQNHALVFRRT